MLTKNKTEDSLKIGVLLPHSKEYPSLSKEFLDGLKLYFTLHDNLFLDRKAELIVEDIGFGTERLSLEKTRKLISVDEVVLIGGVMEFNTALQVGNMAEVMNVPMLIGGLGETRVAREKIPANLYFHSFMLWQSYFELGCYVAESQKDKELQIVTSLFDVGYDANRAFMLGLKSKNYDKYELFISKAYNSDNLIQDLNANFKLDQDKAWCLLLHPELVTGLLEKIERKPKELYTSPFVFGEISQHNVWSFVEFFPGNAKYEEFTNGVKEYFETSPTYHHALGYQQGQLIYHALRTLDGLNEMSSQIYSAWDSFDEVTVTGKTYYNNESKLFESTFHLFKGIDSGGLSRNRMKKGDQIDPSAISELSQDRNQYTNPYMFM